MTASLTFSKDPDIAEQQMNALIVYLTSFGYIDGNFDLSEKIFVLEHIRKLVETRVVEAGITDPFQQIELTNRFTQHFDEVFEHVDSEIRSTFTEVVADSESLERFVYARLKLRCFEIFRAFDEGNRRHLLATVDKLIHADGVITDGERKFRDELAALIDHTPEIPVVDAELEPDKDPMRVRPTVEPPPRPRMENHPLLELMERHYSRDPALLTQQVNGDHDLVMQAMETWREQRAKGEGRLTGKRHPDELAGSGFFLDGHIYGLFPGPGEEVEVTVLGDLHGCYSCLKGALLQADFFRKVQSWRDAPTDHPKPYLVLLGDYIDRGMFSYNGVVRTVLQLLVSMPEHVIVLRGNHEYYLAHRGRIFGGVRPAEAISTLSGHFPERMFEAFMQLFEHMPNMLFLDRTLFVHAGIPRDETFADKYRGDLASLNDPDLRFEMLWSDPSTSDFVPAELQRENARFPFGKEQFRAFMNQVGANTLIRGHEKVEEGCKRIYDEPGLLLVNLFSAGGATNNDLPPDSSYRKVTPMAMTIRWKNGIQIADPWPIDWESYNDPARNNFFKSPPEFEFKST